MSPELPGLETVPICKSANLLLRNALAQDTTLLIQTSLCLFEDY